MQRQNFPHLTKACPANQSQALPPPRTSQRLKCLQPLVNLQALKKVKSLQIA
jgi:hypothetical protein